MWGHKDWCWNDCERKIRLFGYWEAVGTEGLKVMGVIGKGHKVSSQTQLPSKLSPFSFRIINFSFAKTF